MAPPDYPVLLNNLLQRHPTPTGNLSTHFQYVMAREGPEDNVTHIATATFHGEAIAVGRGKAKGLAKAAVAEVVYKEFLEKGVPGT